MLCILYNTNLLVRKGNKRVQTQEVKFMFELTKITTDVYKNKKSGNLTRNEKDSALVGDEGLEPPTPSV